MLYALIFCKPQDSLNLLASRSIRLDFVFKKIAHLLRNTGFEPTRYKKFNKHLVLWPN
jgi:hypothetical protein